MFRESPNSPKLVIGVLTPQTGGFYYGSVVNGILNAVRKRDAVAVAFETTGLEVLRGDSVLSSARVDGWLAVNEFEDSPLLARLRTMGAPVIHLHSRPDIEGGAVVLPDNAGGARTLTEHLIEHGHRRIAFAGNMWHMDVTERLQGYRSAMQAAGLVVTDDLILETPHHKQADGRSVALKLLEGRRNAVGQAALVSQQITALVAATDRLALGALEAFTEHDLHVPEDIALVGFDDTDAAQHAEPPLTTVKQSFAEAADCGVNEILAAIREKRAPRRMMRVPTRSVIRRSCGCLLSQSKPPHSPNQQDDRIGAMTAELLRFASRNLASSLPLSGWPGAKKIAQAIEASIGGAEFSESIKGAWWSGLLAVESDAESSVRVMEIIESALKRWCKEDETQFLTRGVLRNLRVTLMHQWQRSERVKVAHYESVTEAAYRLTNSLMSNGADPSANLEWIRWSGAHHACCALWLDENGLSSSERSLSEPAPPSSGESAMLSVSGEYRDKHLVNRRSVAARISPPHFPPTQLLETAYQEGSIVSIASVPRGRSGEYGLLAVVAPLAFEHLQYVGTPRDWGIQLGAAMDRAQAERELRASAEQDSLTSLANRATFLCRIEELRCAEDAPEFALLFIDLDDFKKINDSLGHEAGDQLLVQIADRLSLFVSSFESNRIPNSNLVARVGGDEFVTVLVGMNNEADAVAAVEQIQASLKEPYELHGRTVFVSASIGVNFGRGMITGAQELLRGADTAMYRAKMRGHSHHEIFHYGMHARALEKLDLDARLRSAMQQDELEIWYQPIVDLATGADEGAEALMRWRSPQDGLIPPDNFLPIAEEVGLSIPLSEWTLRCACREAARFQSELSSSLYLNVNVPAAHIKHPGFVEFVQKVLRESGLNPSILGLELVESTLLDDPAQCAEALVKLRGLGVRIAIDDFGTGYSNLSYLRDFPINTLKIDRSFVKNVPTSRSDNGITRAIVAMGQALGLNIVAEGIETVEQYHFLKRAGCDYGQGYLMARPMELSAYVTRLSQITRARSSSPLPHPPHTGNESGSGVHPRIHEGQVQADVLSLGGPPDTQDSH